MKRGLIAVAVLAAIALSGCASEQDEAQKVEEVTVPYRGGDLHCVSRFWSKSMVLTCDFERFYADNPALSH